MNLGLSIGDESKLRLIQSIALRALTKFNTTQVVDTAFAVFDILDWFKANHPTQIPQIDVHAGLLGDGRVVGQEPVNDFILVRHLVDTNHASIAKLALGSVPVVMAYLAIASTCSKPKLMLPADAISSALNYSVMSLTLDASKLEAWNDNLESAVRRLEPAAEHGNRFKGRKPDSLGPLARAIRAHLKKFPDDKPTKIWNAFVSKPPKNLKFCEIRGVGKYVEYAGKTTADDTNYKHFQNRVAEQRKIVKRNL